MGGHVLSEQLKSPTNYKEQISLLNNKGFTVDDSIDCVAFLSHVNYYRISGYMLPFKNSPVPFSQIIDIYNFDYYLQCLIYKTISKIEVSLRSNLSYYHAHKYGADGYMFSENFGNKNRHDILIHDIEKYIARNSKTAVITHHEIKYGGKLPIWVVIDFFTLGTLSHFYRDMKNSDKAFIALDLYNANYQMVDSWLRCLNDLRNRCAHYSRLYFWKFPSIPKLSKDLDFKFERRLFPQLYILKLMYPYPDKWNDDFYMPLCDIMDKYKNSIDTIHIGFPSDWKDLLKNFIGG